MQISPLYCVSHSYLWLWKLDHEKKIDRRKIDSLKLWCWRLLHILWVVKVTNKQVLEHIKLDILLKGKIIKFHLTYFGHVMRTNSLERAVMLRVISSKRKHGHEKKNTVPRHHQNQHKPQQQQQKLKEAGENRKTWGWSTDLPRHNWMDSIISGDLKNKIIDSSFKDRILYKPAIKNDSLSSENGKS